MTTRGWRPLSSRTTDLPKPVRDHGQERAGESRADDGDVVSSSQLSPPQCGQEIGSEMDCCEIHSAQAVDPGGIAVRALGWRVSIPQVGEDACRDCRLIP